MTIRNWLEVAPLSGLDRRKELESVASAGEPPRKADPALQRLPVWATIGEALRGIASEWKPLLKAIVGPAVLLAAITVEGDYSDYDALRAGVGILASPLLVTLIAVSCHRLLILGVGSLPNPWGFFWTRRETRFWGWSLKLLFGWIVLAGFVILFWTQLSGARVVEFFHSLLALGNLLLSLLIAPAVLCSMYVGARLSLLLAATAVDRESTPGESWRLSSGNGWRLATIIFLPSVLFLPLDVIGSRVLPGLASQTLLVFVGVIWGVLGIASLSKAYCWFSENSSAILAPS